MTNFTSPNWFRKFFQNKNGKLIIWRFPNLPLWGGIIFSALARVIENGDLHDGFHHVSMAFFFTWAYLEIRYGESIFRRLLGVIVLAVIVASYFR